MKNDFYRYKTLYEIVLEENKLLKEKNTNLQNIISQLETEKQVEQPKKSIFYRGLRKIYHIVKR